MKGSCVDDPYRPVRDEESWTNDCKPCSTRVREENVGERHDNLTGHHPRWEDRYGVLELVHDQVQRSEVR